MTNAILAIDVICRKCKPKLVKASQINFHLLKEPNPFFNVICFVLDQVQQCSAGRFSSILHG
jgi:hypothetical protein